MYWILYLALLGLLVWWCHRNLLYWMRRWNALCGGCGEDPDGCRCPGERVPMFTFWDDLDDDERES